MLALYDELHGPITFTVRLFLAGRILCIACLLIIAGLGLLHVIGRKSQSRHRHGVYVLAWMSAGWLIAGLAAVPYLDGVRYWPGEADLGAACFGMLAGWVIGSIHGSLVLWFWPQQ